MGTACGRILFEDWALLDNTVVTVSSEQVQAPKTFLDDPLRSKRWRSELGWNIVAGVNDKLDFTESISGAAVATITAMNYLSGVTLAAEIQTQLNAAATDNTYTVTYSPVTNLFTIARATGIATFDLDWNTGPNAATTIGGDIGFDTSSDDTGGTSYSSDNVSHGSLEWIKFDFGTGYASYPVSAVIAFDGNFDANTVITIQANTIDSWGSPPLSIQLQMDAGRDYIKGIEWLTSTVAYRWWRMLIDNTQNPDGFVEMGVPYVGDYYEPSNGYSAAFTEDREELSSVDIAEEGASFQHVRATRMAYPLQWLGIPTAEKPRWDSLASLVQVGRPFFIAFEPLVDIQKTLYVMLERPMQSVFQAPYHWRFTTNVIEVLQ